MYDADDDREIRMFCIENADGDMDLARDMYLFVRGRDPYVDTPKTDPLQGSQYDNIMNSQFYPGFTTSTPR